MRGLFTLLAILIFCSVAVGQDFGQLLKAVDKVETNLKQMIEEERSTRESQISSLRGDVDQMANNSGSSPKLQAKLKSLRAELGAVKETVDILAKDHLLAGSGPAPVITKQQLAEIWNDIAFLKTENKYLRNLIDKKSQELTTVSEEESEPEVIEEEPEGLAISGFVDATRTVQGATEDEVDFGLGQAEIDIETELGDNVGVAMAIAYNGETGGFELGAAELGVNLYDSEDNFLTSLDIVTGQFDVPFGIDINYYPSIERKLVTAPATVDLTHGGWNDFGLQFSMEATHGNLVVYAVNGFESSFELIDQAQALSLGLSVGDEIDTSPAWAFGTRLGIAPIEALEVGGSFAVGFNESDKDEMTIGGADIQYSFFNFELRGEYIYHTLNRSLDQEDNQGYYFQSTYNIFDKAFVATRYNSFKPDGAEWIGQFSLGLGYAIMEGVEVRFESLIGESNDESQNILQLVAGF